MPAQVSPAHPLSRSADFQVGVKPCTWQLAGWEAGAPQAVPQNESGQFACLALAVLALLAMSAPASKADALVTFEAESGVLGAEWAVSNSSSPAYLTITITGAGNNPGSASRVATYTVNFPEPGVYQLYARVRVGLDPFNDDSLFYATSFGSKSATLNSDWMLVNGLAGVGFSNSAEVVTGGGTLGSGMWKWINLSQFTSQAGFTVSAGNLTQTFQIGARENGLDLDKLVFGTSGVSLAVSNLDSGTLPVVSNPNTNVFVGPDGLALHRFSPLVNGSNAEGANPAAGLAVVNGVLTGTTLNGGANGAGTAFSLNADGSNFVAFRAFAVAPDASNPQGDFAVSGNGFFGTSFAGGNNGVGTVFVGQTNGSVSVLRHFFTVHNHTATNSGGASPTALLALAGGTLYGTTTAGGAGANGTIFALTTNGATFSVLRDFSALNSQTGTNTDGATPWGGLILSGDKLFGTASAGGAGGSGVVFSIGTNGANFTTLHSFAPLDTLAATNADGAIPYGGLVLLSNTLYGTTFAGGSGGRGTIFSLATNGSGFTVLHHFTATHSVTHTNTDGASPSAGLILSSNVLFGTASAGGVRAAGAVFSLNLGNAQFTTLHSFAALTGAGTNAYGAFPVAPVLRLGNSLYGTTFSGGPGAAGTVFRIPLPAPPAVITNVVHNLNGTVTLYFLGGPNSTNVIQATVNMSAPVTWQSVSTNIADATGAWQFTDSNNFSNRFYRSYAP
jgi:uncharacterized repeat protein (TIGR03803 family)